MKKMKLNIQLFANTITTTLIDLYYDDQTGEKENKSAVGITAYFKAGSSETWFNNKTINFYCKKINGDGTETDITPINWDGNTKARTMSCSLSKGGSVTKTFYFYYVPHQADGSLKVRCYWTIATGTSQLGTITEAQTQKTETMRTIPRASAIQSITSGTTNYAPALKWTPNSTTFKYIIRYMYGSWYHQTNYISPNSTSQQTYNSYTITGSSIAPYITSGTSASVLASLFTYTSDDHLVGESHEYFNVALNSNIVPSVSFSSVTEAGDVPAAWGIYVKGKSRVALSLSASGIYGSSISAYRISYYGGAVQTSSATTSYIQNTGNITFTGQVTDSRGRSASTTTTINVVDYNNPTISTAQVQRCDASGNIDKNGEYMYISYGASISSCSSKNTPSAVYKVGYRVHNTGSYTYVPLTSNANSYSASGMLFSDGIKAASATGTKVQFSTSNTYDIQFYVKDYFMEYTNVQSLDTGFDLMNFNESGKAMAIGKVSEAGANEELFETGIPFRIDMNGITNELENSYGYAHYSTDGTNGHWFNKKIDVNGTISSNGEAIGTIKATTFTMNTNISANAWNLMTNSVNLNLNKGTYLIIFNASARGYSSSGGIVTINPAIEGTRLDAYYRQSMPINGSGSTLVAGAQVVVPYTFSTDGNKSFSIYSWSDVAHNGYYGSVRAIKLNGV